ncbi:hypothetical protein [Haloferula sp. A504]|uniref:HzsA-related protein n=1 Tax=Haloferula sp. A504 TaxID=3373601 RepID=UPI0031CB984E|nr:hypothetical protein [Verrucomicrobiaceae bacterium E54]
MTFHFFRVALAVAVPAACFGAHQNTPDTLRAAIEHLKARDGADYPDAAAYLERLEQPANRSGEGFVKLQREALVADPAVGSRPVLFVERDPYRYDHHNTETMFQTGEISAGNYRPGGPLKVVDLRSGEVLVLCDPGPQGHLRDPEVHPDGSRIVFSMRRSKDEDYSIFEIGADGSNLRQLTSATGVFDIDPVYLPDGGIIFSSSREPKYCGCNRHIMANLFRMDADGANIHQLGKSTLFEGHSSITPDGRVLYDRWEYVDRNFGDAQGLWTMNPDGTNHAIYWGNNTSSPGGVIDARIIPGSGRCLCIFTSCHDSPWGALAIIDRELGVDGRSSVVRTWPAEAIELVDRAGIDGFKRVRPKYEDPWPLNETTFLVSRQVEPGKPRMGIFLVDTFGNEVLLHAGDRGCFDPMPLGPRRPDPARVKSRNYNEDVGTFYITDARVGTHMEGIADGEIRYLRVVESPEKRAWTRSAWGGQGQQAPGMNWHNFENKRILGTVPVESDGSAYFEVPAGRFVFFQLLDGDGRMLQSMRSGTIIQSGERQGCAGCHEDRNETIPASPRVPLAMRRPPSKLEGWYGEARLFNYQAEIQPIFDRHCVSCHDFGKPAGEVLNLAGDRTLVFNASYIDLWSGDYLSCVGGGPAQIQQAKSWGSHRSKLVKVLREGHPEHAGLDLPADDLKKVFSWVDLNAPYYPSYESAFPDHTAGRSPLTPAEEKRLASLTGARFVLRHGAGQRTQVSFERPELSPCLAGLDPGGAARDEALAIIRTGAERLRRTPRRDMPGFEPAEVDRRRLEKYILRREIESANQRAIREGRKLYDHDFD